MIKNTLERSIDVNGYCYQRSKKCNVGYLWICRTKSYPAYLTTTENDEVLILMIYMYMAWTEGIALRLCQFILIVAQGDVVKSRLGNKNLLFRQYSYRKQYEKCGRIRWVCATEKYYPKVDVAVISNLGTMLELNGYQYRKTDEYTDDGTRWECNLDSCQAFLIMNDDDEIVSAKELHSHAAKKKWKMITIHEKTKGQLVTSRNGNQNLMYRRFAYRKKYTRGDKIRWVCATMKYCRACLHTNEDLLVLKAYQEHCHAPPKYNYNKNKD